VTLVGRLLYGVRAGEARSRLRAVMTAPATLGLTSPAFTDGAAMPAKHAGKGVGDNVSPRLEWTGQPPATEQLLLIIEDVDVPLPRPLLHTIALIEPHLDALDGGALRPGTPGLRFIPGTLRWTEYAGPRPIPGHGAHHYRFHLLALDQPIPESVTTATALIDSIAGHVAARGMLTGTYQR
jgi:phosphatidylethanolamine-binding protein (PEBP) family uncharacterized protein